MSKFKKKKKGLPAISTASLPDIVFMLLFFFMVSTTMRDPSIKVSTSLPSGPAEETKKLEHKSLVNTIYIGRSLDGKFGNSFNSIQLNDRVVTDVKLIKNFIFNSRAKLKQENVPKMTTIIKADQKMEIGVLTDIRKELQNVNQLKLSLSINPKAEN